MKEFKFAPGDYLLSKRFGWQYKIISIRNGVAVLQDIVRENVRVRFTLRTLHNRIEIDSFAHSPHPFSYWFWFINFYWFLAVQTSSLI